MDISHPFPAQAEAEEKSREAERRLEAATAAALRRGEDTETAAMAVLQRQVQEAQDAEEALSARFFEHGKGLNDARKALGEAVWGDADKYSEEGVPTWPRYLPHRWVADATGDAARARAAAALAAAGLPAKNEDVDKCLHVLDVLTRDQNYVPTKQVGHDDVFDEAFPAGRGHVRDYAASHREIYGCAAPAFVKALAGVDQAAVHGLVRDRYGAGVAALLRDLVQERITHDAIYPTPVPWDEAADAPLSLAGGIRALVARVRELKARGA